MAKEYPIVDNVESFEAALARVRAAQKVYATYTQEQVDKIFKAAALAANNGMTAATTPIGSATFIMPNASSRSSTPTVCVSL